MTAPRPLYLLSPPGSGREGTARALDVPPDRVFDGATDFLPLAGREPGVVLLPPDALPSADVGAVLVACVVEDPRWVPALVLEEAGGAVVLPLSSGYRYGAADLARFCATGEGEVVLGLQDVVERVRIARHDINNPLAAALAETQLLLMDVEDGEVRSSLQTIQEQIRRIRDLLSALKLARPTRGEPPHGDPLPR